MNKGGVRGGSGGLAIIHEVVYYMVNQQVKRIVQGQVR
jgi:hypothetical protein